MLPDILLPIPVVPSPPAFAQTLFAAVGQEITFHPPFRSAPTGSPRNSSAAVPYARFFALTGVQELGIDYPDTPKFMSMLQRYFGHFLSTVRSLDLRESRGSCRHTIYFIGLFRHLEDIKHLCGTGGYWEEPVGGLTLTPLTGGADTLAIVLGDHDNAPASTPWTTHIPLPVLLPFLHSCIRHSPKKTKFNMWILRLYFFAYFFHPNIS